MSDIKVKRGKPIASEIRVPGDKSISHRALIAAALSNGPCEISGFLPSSDCLATLQALRQIGVKIDILEEVDDFGPTRLLVHGRRMKFSQPAGDIDCGNSGTTMRLLAGLLAGQPFKSRLVGDESLSRRPMGRIIDPLTEMGADIKALGEKGTAPLAIDGGKLQAIHYTLPVASAQVKSAILLAGLFCEGKTTVTQPLTTRDHTERLLGYFLVKTRTIGQDVSVYGGQMPESRDFAVPGDVSSAAYWVTAAAAQPGSKLTIHDVGLNDTRSGFLRVLVRMGAHIAEIIETVERGEPKGRIEVRGGALRGTGIGGDEIPNVIDELPILAVAGALAEGSTVIRDAQELRVKETDRIAAIANNLREMGVTVQDFYDGLEIEGRGVLKGTRLPSFNDHRIAMAFSVAGLFAVGETVIDDMDCARVSYPGFEDELKLFMSSKISGEGEVAGPYGKRGQHESAPPPEPATPAEEETTGEESGQQES